MKLPRDLSGREVVDVLFWIRPIDLEMVLLVALNGDRQDISFMVPGLTRLGTEKRFEAFNCR
jgi:hypothetical protein